MALPNTKVEIAFNAGYTTSAGSRTWTDVSAYVEAQDGLSISRGRPDELSEVQPSSMTVTLDNRDGRFTPGKTDGAYYPNVKKGRPIRVTCTYDSVEYVRFLGYVNEWPVSWPDSSDSTSVVQISASSRTARLGLSAELRATDLEEVALNNPEWHYPCDEASGAAYASDTSGNQFQGLYPGLNFLGWSGPPDVTFGQTITLPDGREFAAIRTSYNGALFTKNQVPDIAWIGASFTATSELGFAGASIVNISSVNGAAIRLDSSGQAEAVGYGLSCTGGSVVNDGAAHTALVRVTPGASGRLDLFVDGSLVATSSTTSITLGSDPGVLTVGTAQGVTNEMLIARVFGGSTTLSDASAADITSALPTGFSGEATGSRIARYSLYAGVPESEQSFDDGTVPIGATDSTGQTPIAIMHKIVETENGILYDGRDSVGSLVFKDRNHRYNVAESFSLDVAAQEVQGELLPRLDDQYLVNDVTATGVGDITIREVDEDSVDEYGFYRRSVSVLTSVANEVAAIAQWQVGLGKEPEVRYPSISVDITNISDALAADLLTADISTRFRLDNLPDQAPADTADLFVEGYQERITEAAHTITFNTSPTTGYAGAVGVWQLDVNNIDGPYVLAL